MLSWVVALNVLELGGAQAPRALGQLVQREPENQPQEPGTAGRDERRAPAPGVGQPRDDRGRQDRTHVRPRVEHGGGQGAFPAREPMGDRFDGGRKVSSLTEPERDACREKAADTTHQCVAHRRQAPRRDRQGVARARAEAVDERAEAEQSHRVGGLKGRIDLPELLVAPAQLGIENRLEQRQDLAVDVIDGGREKEQRANRPPVPADARLRDPLTDQLARRKSHGPAMLVGRETISSCRSIVAELVKVADQ